MPVRPRRAYRVGLRRRHEHIPGARAVDVQVGLLLARRRLGERGVGVAVAEEKSCAGAAMSPEKTWFHTKFDQPVPRSLLRT